MSANKKDLIQAEGVLENVDSAVDNTKVKSESEKTVEKKPAAKKTTRTTKTAAKKTEENVKETPAIKTTTKKTPAKTTTKKTTTKTTEATKKVVEPAIIVKIQYNGKEVDQQEMIERVKADWIAKGNDLKNMKTLATYIKPEEDSVYYAVNDELNSGRIDF